MNKKAFTLIEVLAVIVLLGVIAGIAVPNVKKIIERSRETKCEADKNAILDAAMNFANDCINNNNGCKDNKPLIKSLRSVEDLINNEYLDKKYENYKDIKFYIEKEYNANNMNAEAEADYKYDAILLEKIVASKYNDELYTLRNNLGRDASSKSYDYPAYVFYTKNDISNILSTIDPNNNWSSKHEEFKSRWYLVKVDKNNIYGQIFEEYDLFNCK